MYRKHAKRRVSFECRGLPEERVPRSHRLRGGRAMAVAAFEVARPRQGLRDRGTLSVSIEYCPPEALPKGREIRPEKPEQGDK